MTTQTIPEYDCWQLTPSEYRECADYLRTVADEQGAPEHCDDPNEVEHLRTLADRVEALEMDPPNWAIHWLLA